MGAGIIACAVGVGCRHEQQATKHCVRVLGPAALQRPRGQRQPRRPNSRARRGGSEGMVCDNMFSNHPLCSPYRAILLTGQFGWRNGVIDNEYRAAAGYSHTAGDPARTRVRHGPRRHLPPRQTAVHRGGQVRNRLPGRGRHGPRLFRPALLRERAWTGRLSGLGADRGDGPCDPLHGASSYRAAGRSVCPVPVVAASALAL